MDNNAEKKTSLGLAENIESLLCYVLGFVTGIVFLILEKENKTVKFHALQSTITFLALFVVGWILGRIPILGWLLNTLISLLELVLWIVLMVKAYKGEMFKLPVVGDIAEQQTNKQQ